MLFGLGYEMCAIYFLQIQLIMREGEYIIYNFKIRFHQYDCLNLNDVYIANTTHICFLIT